uniref:Uncharacterized protein n=2 Tax=Rhizophora mucronata TaxID=61149 RepID=A0A2P2JW35_RHIMU
MTPYTISQCQIQQSFTTRFPAHFLVMNYPLI